MNNEQEIKKQEIEELETKIRGMISERQFGDEIKRLYVEVE